jgi:hypothetical protein
MSRGLKKRKQKQRQLRRNSPPDKKERVATYDVQYIMPMVMDMPARIGKAHKVLFRDMPVNMANDRLRTFLHSGTKCVECGLEGEFFALERFCDTDDYHLNLYGIRNGKEVLFTKDHIVPRSKGGPSQLDNYQTMCSYCNGQKGNGIEPRFILQHPTIAALFDAPVSTDDQITIYN